MNRSYHEVIDARLLCLATSVIEKIDSDPALRAWLAQNVSRWPNAKLRAKWRRLLRQPRPILRAQLLAETEKGAALRQDAPLGGILTTAERTRIMREFAYDPSAA